jgi:hypothetical protein
MSRPLVFISYARHDVEVIRRIVADLEARGAAILIDEKDIKVGDSITGFVEDALSRSDFVSLALSDRSVSRPWVIREYRSALAIALSNGGGRPRILPLLLENCAIPPLLRDIRYADFGQSYEVGLNDLVYSVGLALNPSPLIGLLDWLATGRCARRGFHITHMTTDDKCNYELMLKVGEAIEGTVAEIKGIPRERLIIDQAEQGDIKLILTPEVTYKEHYIGDDFDDAPIITISQEGVQAFVSEVERNSEAIRKRQVYVLPVKYCYGHADAGELGPPDDIQIDVQKILSAGRT